MSIIACTGECIYQKDGCCRLDWATSRGEDAANGPCIHYVPKRQSSKPAEMKKSKRF
jgi:hypothetical protein